MKFHVNNFCLLLFSIFVFSEASAEKFVAISKHMLLTDKGNVYSIDTGFEEDGPWGNLGKEFYLGRKEGALIGKVEFLNSIKKIIVAHSSFLAINFSGEVFVWGSNEEKRSWADKRRCGGYLGKNKAFIEVPEQLKFKGEKIKDVVYRPCVTMSALSESGGLYMWGWGKELDKNYDRTSPRFFDDQAVEIIDIKLTPKKIPTDKKIISASPEILLASDGGILFFGASYLSVLNSMREVLPKCEDYLCEVAESRAKYVTAFSEIMMKNGDVYYPEAYRIDQGHIRRQCISYIDNYSYITCDGNIYRAGIMAKYESWVASVVSDFSNDFELVYRRKDIVNFQRDAFVTKSGQVFVYGYDHIGGYLPLYRNAIKQSYPELDLNDLDDLINYYKVADSMALNGGAYEY